MKTFEQFFLSSSNIEGEASYYKGGKGFPIVLLHGFAETADIWNSIRNKLAEKYQLIIPQIPGCGTKNHFINGLSMEQIADFVSQILAKEKIEKTILFGHSMGGYASMAFAEKYEDKLIGLSLVHSSALADSSEKKEIRQKAINHIKNHGSDGFFKSLIPKLYGELSDYALEKKEHLAMARQYSAQQIISCYEAMKNRPDRKHILQKLNCAVQFIGGKQDQSVHYEDLEKQAKLCTNSNLHIFNGIGHSSMYENPKLLLAAIIGFVDDILETNEL